MAFKLLHPVAPADIAVSPADPAPASRQIALRLNGGRPGSVSPKPPSRTPSDIKLYIGHLSSQIEALRQQLREHSSDRIAMLLREMIEERERELERWVAREEAWDRRVASIEAAIVERDAFRHREAELVRERDEAQRAAATAAAQRDTAQRIAEAARREAESARRVADKTRADELRLRAERELDRQEWMNQRRALEQQADRRGWLSRLVKR
ncbi:MAG TPA: hypothetical protein VFA22_01795 [Stellaceae bacterium]|nr:hypothetical protein [Stellaceae bacterium]